MYTEQTMSQTDLDSVGFSARTAQVYHCLAESYRHCTQRHGSEFRAKTELLSSPLADSAATSEPRAEQHLHAHHGNPPPLNMQPLSCHQKKHGLRIGKQTRNQKTIRFAGRHRPNYTNRGGE